LLDFPFLEIKNQPISKTSKKGRWEK
jgi:hypothetical protein